MEKRVMGLDWDAIRSNYEKTASPRELGPPKPKGKDPFANGGRYTGSEPEYDRDKMVEMYAGGSTVQQIAKSLGCSFHTVRNGLDSRGVKRRDERTDNRPRKTHCKNDHEFTPENTRVRPNGSRECRTCERERNKERSKRGRK